jgi:hypothetical protein
MRQTIEEIQDLVAQADPKNQLSTDNFLGSRRKEAKRDTDKWDN